MQHFTSDGVQIACYDAPATQGDRSEPILLVHGFASSYATNWLHTHWVRTLAHAGRRVIGLDNRGHGKSGKPHLPAAYHTDILAEDCRRLLDHLGIERADVMGYSMGARITAFLALAHPGRVRSAIFGGLGAHLVEGVGLPMGVAEAMEAPSLDRLHEPTQRMFRAFAEQGKNDLHALAACIRGTRQTLSVESVGRIRAPALVAIGSHDHIAGDSNKLAAMLPEGRAFVIAGKDHNSAVGDRTYKSAVLAFLEDRP
ncbi:MAG: alpha/beta hydrolase [Methylobacteriaceae bacterium]|nr:alpha/beta hydrolase [Methylobacteriaceae bacterium]